MDLGKILPLAIAGLAFLNLIFGFLSVQDSTYGSSSVYAALGWSPALLIAAGVIAAGSLLPKKSTSPLAVAGLSFAGGFGALFAFFDVVSPGIGFILILIFGLIQGIAGVVLLLIEGGIIPSAPVPGAPAGPSAGGPAGPGFNQPPAPQQFQPAPPAPEAPAAPTYGGYSAQSEPNTGGYGVPTGPSSGAVPAVGQPPAGQGYGQQSQPGQQGQGGPDDGPNPDVTQQVRF
ncbi:hypothetical protein GIS00_10020 [Nakamurella sp. YIM 132087]|uniref:DUF5336 domain-containing protein n=2 Tax=Nakamurella alba TaxID=2665158 RepID=A0A7K1FM12_9ACTN|nr:hypothetical protein [Nakamurella alba]